MTLSDKQLSRVSIAVVVATTILLVACTDEKTADSNQQVKKAVSSVTTVTEDKIAKWQKEAQAGDADAQYNLAYIYENGLGVPKNEAKALELYQQAADQGHSGAKSNLDTMSSSK